jgi:tetratricopeptide (TPR) repeat protein
MPEANYRSLLKAGLLGLAFSLVNPNTYHAIEYLKAPALSSALINIEYQSTLFILRRLNLYRIAISWLVLVLTLLGLAVRWKKPDITTIALLVGLGGVSFFRSRYVPFFIVAAVPVAAACLSEDRIRKWSRPAVVCLALLSALCFSWADRAATIVPGSGMWLSRTFPEQEADFIIQQDLKGTMYNSPDWGGYLMWRLAPARKVFSDGRALDVPSYLDAGTIESAQSQPGPGPPAWQRLLDAYDVQYLCIPLFSDGVIQPLVNALMNAREWSLVFAGYNSLIFVRASPVNGRVLATRSLSKDRYLDDTIAWYTQEAARKPNSRFVHLARGELLMIRRRFPEARAAYARVLELAPFNLVARSRLQTIP